MRLNPFKKKPKRRSRAAASHDGWLTPYAKKAILGIVLLVFALIALMSYVGAAGPTGEFILRLLGRMFGWLGYLAPFGILALAAYLIWPQRMVVGRLRGVGLLLSLIGLLGLLHTIGATTDDALQLAHDGRGGGYVGFLLSFPLSQALSRIASLLIFVGALLVGLILTFRISPADVWDWFAEAWSSKSDVATAGNEEGDFDEDTEEEGQPRFQVNAVVRAADVPEAEQIPTAGSMKQVRVTRRYKPQILKLLHQSAGIVSRSKDQENTTKETIRRTLEHFGIGVEMAEANVGPTVTQYTLRPEEGTKLARITALQNDLALALAAHPIRIEAPIPNRNLVGIEIPNKKPSLVRLRELLSSKNFKKSESPLSFPLGLDVSGEIIVDTIDRLPHLLIAGATGSGKSVHVHTLLISLLYRNSPEALRLILVDPKRVELTAYNNIPHLLTPVIVDTEKTLNALKWALEEMDVRYRLLEESSTRNMISFNLSNPAEARPSIVIVIDELADLMVKHAREVEGPIVRLSQMARAVGIHLVLATQRPSVNVITGLIKANFPARIAFSVASQVDSRTILDQSGAEKLVGNGDMLYLAGDKARPLRIQGGFVSEDEVHRVVAVIKQTGQPNYEEAVVASSTHSGGGGRGDAHDNADDPLLEEAKQLVISSGKASASLLQRRLRVGYARAARLLDMMEDEGVIGEAEGNKPRAILVDGADEDSGSEDDSLGEDYDNQDKESKSFANEEEFEERTW